MKVHTILVHKLLGRRALYQKKKKNILPIFPSVFHPIKRSRKKNFSNCPINLGEFFFVGVNVHTREL